MAQPVHAQLLANVTGKTLEQLKKDVDAGGRFIVYQYTISLVAITLRRMTQAYFVPAGMPANAYKKSANTTSLILGWWCIPWGPIRTLQSLKVNNKGGIDVTKDVMLNLTEEDLAKGQVILEYVATTIIAPNKTDTREATKAIRKFLENEPDITEVYFGLYINTNDPHLVFGIVCKDILPNYIDDFKSVLYKYYYKSANFLIVDLNDGSQIAKELLELGLRVGRE